jgi:hypothetical protein
MNKKAKRVVHRLRKAGKPELAARLIEAFKLDKEFDSQKVDEFELEVDPGLASLDDDEVSSKTRNLERFIPASASMPDDLEDEKSLVFDTGVFRVPKGLRRKK